MGLHLIDYLILTAVFFLILFAVRLYKKREKNGCCGNGESGSCGSSCGHCRKCKDKK